MDIKQVLTCKKCGNRWRYADTKWLTTCPLCGEAKDARDRRKYSQGYLQKHPERSEKLRQWGKSHQKEHSRKVREDLMRTVFALVSKSPHPSCTSCGCDDRRLLEINHKDGGGGKEMAKGKASMTFYRDIAMLRRPVDDLEILCRVCNALHYLETKYGKLPMSVTWNK